LGFRAKVVRRHSSQCPTNRRRRGIRTQRPDEIERSIGHSTNYVGIGQKLNLSYGTVRIAGLRFKLQECARDEKVTPPVARVGPDKRYRWRLIDRSKCDSDLRACPSIAVVIGIGG